MDEDIEYMSALNKLKRYNQEQLLDRYEFLIEEKKQIIKRRI